MRSAIAFVLLFTASLATASAQEGGCQVAGNEARVIRDGQTWTARASAPVFDCVVLDSTVVLAMGDKGMATWRWPDDASTESRDLVLVEQALVPGGDVVRLDVVDGKVAAVVAALRMVPMIATPEGTLTQESLTGILVPASGSTPVAPGTDNNKQKAESSCPAVGKPSIPQGKVVSVSGNNAVLDLGKGAGVAPGQRFEIRSQEPVTRYDLQTRQETTLPSNEVTAVSEVIQVTEEQSLVRLGRGNRARPGDVAEVTDKPLSETFLHPAYERSLHRIQAKIAPFIGIESINVGFMGSITYDYAFSFPMRVEAGLRNGSILIGKDPSVPFELTLVPSYDTDLFEVGIGVGYQYSSNPDKSGLLFIQKARLGTVDGLNLQIWNSFIYQSKDDIPEWYPDWESGVDGWTHTGVDCYIYDDQGNGKSTSEFAWNGFEGDLSFPITAPITMFAHGAYSQAGWLYTEVGIRTWVKGNGGDGTLVIPVGIGGSATLDWDGEKLPGGMMICNPDDNKTAKICKTKYHSDWIGGPVITIGIDYRWR